LGDLHHDRAVRDEQIGRRRPAINAGVGDDGEEDIGQLLRAAVGEATGLRGKRPVRVDIVSPALDSSGRPAEELLAGEKLGHFFGFVDKRFRQNDFTVGYRNMRTFLLNTLPDYGLGDEVVNAVEVVDAKFDELGWARATFGNADVGDVGVKAKLRLGRLAAHTVHVVWTDVHNWSRGLPVDGIGHGIAATAAAGVKAVGALRRRGDGVGTSAPPAEDARP
jgi:hypothetical protein